MAVLLCIVLAVCFLTNPAKAANTETDADIYGKIVKELGDHDTYALLAMNYAYPVLLTSLLPKMEFLRPPATR